MKHRAYRLPVSNIMVKPSRVRLPPGIHAKACGIRFSILQLMEKFI